MKKSILIFFCCISIFANAQNKNSREKKFYKLVLTDSIFVDYYYFEFRRHFRYYKYIVKKSEFKNDSMCYNKLKLGNRYELNTLYMNCLKYEELINDSIHEIYVNLYSIKIFSENKCFTIGGNKNTTIRTSPDIKNMSISCNVEVHKGLLIWSIRPLIRCAYNRFRYRNY